MSIESALALVVAIFVLGITPGPGVFAIVARALALGFRPTLVFIVGVIVGDLVYLVLAALGLSVIATQYSAAFGLLKIAGGLYLIYLGIQTWRSAKHVDTGLTPTPERGGGRSFLSGLSLTLGNPKVVVFYVAFLPAFMDLGALSTGGLISAAVVVSVTLFAVMAGYAWMASRARALFRSNRAVKNLHRGAGGLMIGAGGAVAVS
ncbi:LysE family translocator [Magnetovibrio sp.]|uniref:LysE family translocator n=1 Tax=Magnetovibrio sp. TaxID=2024836 RepID=UPI002F95A77B